MSSEIEIILIDNYDSFTYNLVELLEKLTGELTVFRNDVAINTVEKAINPKAQTVLVLSPGPGAPQNAGNMLELITHFRGRLPILGICLGHQALALAYGAEVTHARAVVHGKASNIDFTVGHPVFKGFDQAIKVARYHSLIAKDIKAPMQVLAWLDDEAMCIADANERVLGFQFHPESILTTQGNTLTKNAIEWLTEKNFSEEKDNA